VKEVRETTYTQLRLPQTISNTSQTQLKPEAKSERVQLRSTSNTQLNSIVREQVQTQTQPQTPPQPQTKTQIQPQPQPQPEPSETQSQSQTQTQSPQTQAQNTSNTDLLNKVEVCRKCQKPILKGGCIEAKNYKWHEECFICTNCSKRVTGRVAFLEEQLHCEACARSKLEARKKAATLSGGTFSRNSTPASRLATKTGELGLLQWCKVRTQGYKNVEVAGWVKSWKDGLALCALIHSYHPDRIDFDSLSPENAEENIKLGLKVLQEVVTYFLFPKTKTKNQLTSFLKFLFNFFIHSFKQLGAPEILDAEDFALEEKSMKLFLSTLYKHFEGV
jgi:hypothetical protein